jgi:hypothetical protein
MEKKAILRTLAYADIFDYPLKEKEIWRFLISAKGCQLEEINQTIKKMPEIASKESFFFLKGRRKIVGLRKKRARYSQEKKKLARQIVNWLKFIPTIKLIGVTGALAMNNVNKKDDIDLFFITAKNRLWLSRGLIVTVLRLTGRYRRPQRIKDMICPNMFLDESHLTMPRKEQNLFSAHEVCQLRPLWNKDGTYQKFLKANQWVKKYLPNWKP